MASPKQERQPSIFIGSSTECLEYANALQKVLDRDLVTTLWTYGVFTPGRMTLASLLDRARKVDFAALFLTPDDESVVRSQYLKTPRDNLIFELGLFIGVLGPERAFLLIPREQVDLPGDLQGLTPITYRTDRNDDDSENAINPAATDIRRVARTLGPREHERGSRAKPRSSHIARTEVLVAIGRLGSVASHAGATLEVAQVGSRYQLVVVDGSRLGTSVEVDLSDGSAVRAINGLSDLLEADPR